MSAPSPRRIESPPSITQLAASALRNMIFSGELQPGDRVVENHLIESLGVSKPPLREAMAVLEQEGLIVRTPRRGAVVTPLTLHDVYEIFTLRHDLERLAVDLGVPCRAPERINRCREAYAALERAAQDGDPAAVTERGFAFHLAVVGLAGHRRLEEAYRALALQLRLCMAMNRQARRSRETLLGDAQRHRRILELVERGDTAAVHHELAHHGDRTFLLDAGDTFPGGSPESLAWLESVRQQENR
ncbi:GntR family transcriptional regulator [Pseudonocardia nigra]|uniref:GntR family transcriptional regulator n=1 Tax=Pseudonocardia nigra TaxID=1921578 RepID=UPI0027E28065|nr:GntR family transcriptional regulator [Pseudonocardia nigra]